MLYPLSYGSNSLKLWNLLPLGKWLFSDLVKQVTNSAFLASTLAYMHEQGR
jgi:hypothetical protein